MHASHVRAEGTTVKPSLTFFFKPQGVAVRSPAARIHWRVGSLRLPTNRRSFGALPDSLVPSLKESQEE
jgi:hypothetical protein